MKYFFLLTARELKLLRDNRDGLQTCGVIYVIHPECGLASFCQSNKTFAGKQVVGMTTDDDGAFTDAICTNALRDFQQDFSFDWEASDYLSSMLAVEGHRDCDIRNVP